eukprot:TRINITY_DN585_c1_g1_i1.p1 TRINITY_DN585_c1_g1~~TRINITY_DN585_c1_g1_i1.p1  ORF type:complete len:1040 (+),score=299.57 TRINITY_DN585_c1_g1_i1:95-3214(+)
MLHNRTFVKKTRKGKILKVVREHYLRDSIPCGSKRCSTCDPSKRILSDEAVQYLVPDANVLLRQTDFLQHEFVNDVILLQTAMEGVKSRQFPAYRRLRDYLAETKKRFFVFSNEFHRPCFCKRRMNEEETMDERDERAILQSIEWLSGHYNSSSSSSSLAKGRVEVVLLTDSRSFKNVAEKRGIKSVSCAEYAAQVGQTSLSDVVSHVLSEEQEDGKDGVKPGAASDKRPYEEHLSKHDLDLGVRNGSLFEGIIRMNTTSSFHARVYVGALEKQVWIDGRENVNRAVSGDLVVIRLLAQSSSSKDGALGTFDNSGGVESDEDSDIDADEVGKVEKSLSEAAKVFGLPQDEFFHERELKRRNQKKTKKGKKERKDGSGNDENRGVVVGIRKRNWRPLCGSIMESEESGTGFSKGQHSVLFVPVNQSFPRVRIMSHQLQSLVNQRIIVSLDSWPSSSRYPMGHFVRALGPAGDMEVESEVILLEHEVPHYEFPEKVLGCLPPDDWHITQEEYDRRLDLRDREIASVDPPGCRDIDDALHVKFLGVDEAELLRKSPAGWEASFTGKVEIGVHIADVTHFLHEGTPMDEEAALRATSVYLVDRRIDMLPKLLTENLCSLRGKVERLAFSVLWEFDFSKMEYHVKQFGKSVISSRAALSYIQAQQLVDGLPDDTVPLSLEDQKAMASRFRIMLRIARFLKSERMKQGALVLASAEMKFKLDDSTHDPTDVAAYTSRETNSMVEEFMLLANQAVARRITEEFPTFALLRRHPAPLPHSFDSLSEIMDFVGLNFDTATSKALSESLEAVPSPSDRPYLNRLVRILTTRCMQQAVYFPSGDVTPDQFHHYGLAMNIYTHFTSPIRRYADVLVHRLLAAAIGIAPLSGKLTSRESMQGVTKNLNERNRNARFASTASSVLFSVLYFVKHGSDKVDAYIVSIDERKSRVNVNVFVPRYGLEGILLFDAKIVESDKFHAVISLDSPSKPSPQSISIGEKRLRKKGMKIDSSSSSMELKLFDRIPVLLEVEDQGNYRRRLVIRLIPPLLRP